MRFLNIPSSKIGPNRISYIRAFHNRGSLRLLRRGALQAPPRLSLRGGLPLRRPHAAQHGAPPHDAARPSDRPRRHRLGAPQGKKQSRIWARGPCFFSDLVNAFFVGNRKFADHRRFKSSEMFEFELVQKLDSKGAIVGIPD